MSTLSGPAKLDRDAYALWFLVGKTTHKCQRALAFALEDIDLSVAQHDLLAAIDRFPDSTQNDIAERLFVVKSNVSNLMKKLETRGLIQRRENDSDARAKRIRLTRSGRQLLKQANQRQAGVIEQMLGGLTERDIRQTRRVMERVSQALAPLA